MAVKHVLRKKGVFFTAVAIMLVIAISASYFFYDGTRYREQIVTDSIRIRTADSFTADIERDMQRSLYIASFRALLGAVQHVTDTGEFMHDSEEGLKELVLYGTINGSYTDMTEDSYFFEWRNRVKNIARQLGLYLNLTNVELDIHQEGPWSVTFEMNAELSVVDPLKDSRWDRTENVKTEISILEFEDPLYTVESGKKIINTIRRTPIDDFVNGEDTTNLTIHMENSYYRESDSGPSFLMRLEGNLSSPPSGTGIESLINIDQLSFQGFDTNKSIVDYIYWGGITTESFAINGTNFRLDNESDHLKEYEVENIAYK